MATNQRSRRAAPTTARTNQRTSHALAVPQRPRTTNDEKESPKRTLSTSPTSPGVSPRTSRRKEFHRQNAAKIQNEDEDEFNGEDGLVKLSTLTNSSTLSSSSSSSSSSSEGWGFVLSRRILMEMLAKKRGTIDLNGSPYAKNKWTQTKKIEEVREKVSRESHRK